MPTTLEDKHAIEELISTYNQSLDRGDYATWLGCWADDGVLDGLGRLLTGKPEIRAFADAYDANYRLRLHALKHYTVNILSVIGGDGDRATSTSYLQLVNTAATGVRTIFTGHYEDDLTRVAGRWQFAIISSPLRPSVAVTIS